MPRRIRLPRKPPAGRWPRTPRWCRAGPARWRSAGQRGPAHRGRTSCPRRRAPGRPAVPLPAASARTGGPAPPIPAAVRPKAVRRALPGTRRRPNAAHPSGTAPAGASANPTRQSPGASRGQAGTVPGPGVQGSGRSLRHRGPAGGPHRCHPTTAAPPPPLPPPGGGRETLRRRASRRGSGRAARGPRARATAGRPPADPEPAGRPPGWHPPGRATLPASSVRPGCQGSDGEGLQGWPVPCIPPCRSGAGRRISSKAAHPEPRPGRAWPERNRPADTALR